MSKESLNRAQRRRQQRDARVHVPSFWDSMFNRVWVIALGAVILGTIVYGAMPKGSQTATAPKPPAQPAAPATTPPPTPSLDTSTKTATTPPAAPATGEKVKTEDVKVGSGAEVKAGDTISVQYTGTLTDGTKFDSSYDHGGQPYTFTVGQPGTIQGWSDGVVGMKEGGKRKLTIPASLGYGASGRGKIPPNATLLFDLEVVKVEPKR